MGDESPFRMKSTEDKSSRKRSRDQNSFRTDEKTSRELRSDEKSSRTVSQGENGSRPQSEGLPSAVNSFGSDDRIPSNRTEPSSFNALANYGIPEDLLETQPYRCYFDISQPPNAQDSPVTLMKNEDKKEVPMDLNNNLPEPSLDLFVEFIEAGDSSSPSYKVFEEALDDEEPSDGDNLDS